ncbi:type II secretion system F family protein [uncultured Schumannella sp.]|uniref:type II secretion system F family protein n=1 Tax=uncultured Schumannella sp. TaxID=1195956 RepID=UPI0026001472|nr:type II secretion system F family protein [uncultured Schumannella sp.]
MTSWILGILLGAGVLLVASPWLWPRVERAPAASRWGDTITHRLAQAGLARVRPELFLATSVLLGLAAGTVTLGLSGIPALGLAAAVASAGVPWLVVSSRARRRRRLARAAWPDLIDHLVAGMRSGLSLTESIGSLAGHGAPEFREAFAAFDREARARGTLGPALDELKARLADPVADRVVETLRLARDVGGTELPGLLRGLASALRREQAARAEAEARQSWVVSAARLGVAAPWIVLLVLASRPEAAAVYASPGGTLLLLAGFVVTVVAYRLMVALGRLPEERRWFA